MSEEGKKMTKLKESASNAKGAVSKTVGTGKPDGWKEKADRSKEQAEKHKVKMAKQKAKADKASAKAAAKKAKAEKNIAKAKKKEIHATIQKSRGSMHGAEISFWDTICRRR